MRLFRYWFFPLIVLLASEPVSAAPGGRLGTLIRWYLREKAPARREDYLEAIERLVAGDVLKVATAIRAGAHFDHSGRPVLKKGGPAPRFSMRRPRLQPVADSAGDFAQLVLPYAYSSLRRQTLIVELAPSAYGALVDPPDTVVLRVWPQRHGQARQHAWAAEGLALSLIAHVFELVPVDPDRVFLRGDTSVAALAWYIALNNPDRFAGVFTSRGHWADGVRSAPNARGFAAFVLREPGRRPITPFLGELTRVGAEHVVFDRPLTTKSKEDMRSRVQAWMRNVKRAPRAQAITLVGARPTKVRSRWLRMSPRLRSERESSVARRWAYRALSRPGVITATIHKGNLVDVKTDRVTSFEVFVDPVHFDLKKPLRIRVNGRVPESHLIHLEAAHILEDYRRRRDPGLLYGFKVAVSVRDR